MKKASKARKPAKAKAPTQKRRGQSNPILDVLKSMDPDLLVMLRQTLQQEMGLAPEMAAPKDPVEMFDDYLERCSQDAADEDAKNELAMDLIVALSDLQIDANGGNREARGKIQAIHDLLDDAIEDDGLPPVDLMVIGKIFADAGWAVPDRLKQVIAEALRSSPPDARGVAGDGMVSSLLDLADSVGQNPFDLHDQMKSLMASFPAEATAVLLAELVAGKMAVIDQAVAGFLMDPDPGLAQSVAEALTASATQTPVASVMIERLVHMRPWLPPARQAHLDATIRAMRSNALPPVKATLPTVIKCYASICDGSGARSLIVTRRLLPHYPAATVLIKPSGVVDTMVFPDMSKSAMDGMVRQMKSRMPVVETDLAGIARMLGLGIADNLAAGTLPPFRLVEVIESLGLSPIQPDHASPIDIITGLLADLPPEQADPPAVARAHAEVLDSEVTHQWFEVGEALEDLLHPVKGSRQRVAKLMKTYLPGRRPFWARQCAISALAMRGIGQTQPSLWKALALVGRDIASDVPLDQIPLMKRVADVSVRVFERRP